MDSGFLAAPGSSPDVDPVGRLVAGAFARTSDRVAAVRYWVRIDRTKG